MWKQLILVTLLATSVGATTYYVDPDAGSNGNDGDVVSTPWETPPGTRNTGNTDWKSATYATSGADITTSNKVACGDVILLKGGTTHDSGDGGAWRIDGNFYTGCTSASPIQIRVATNAEWTGSTTDFTLNGTGITPTCVNNCGASGYAGLLDIENIDGIEVKGISASQRINVLNSGGSAADDCAVMVNGTSLTAVEYLVLDYLELYDSEVGLGLGGATTWRLSNSIVHGSDSHGIDLGLHVDKESDKGAIVSTEVYGNGLTADTSKSDGVYLVAVLNFWMIDSQVHGEQTNGINGGSVHTTGNPQNTTYRARVRNSQFWNNGISTDVNSARSGTSWGGDGDVSAPHSYLWQFYNIWYGHPGAGIWAPHDSGREYVWNTVLFGNSHARDDLGDIWWERTSDAFELHNSIVPRRSYNTYAWGHHTANQTFDVKPVSNYNLYDFSSAQTETLSAFRWTTGFSANAVTYQSGAADLGFDGANDLISTTGTNYTPAFTSIGGNCDTAGGTFADCDFTLQGTSDAIDAGTFFLRASGSGTNATRVTVKKGDPASGSDAELADPRNFFIEPTSYPGATGDTIEIEGCGEVTITAMTATYIDFTPACSWADDAGIHLPWNGPAPDIGAYEYAACHGAR